MPRSSPSNTNIALRNLPSVDQLLTTAVGREISASAGEGHAVKLARIVVSELRAGIRADGGSAMKDDLLAAGVNNLEKVWAAEQLGGTHRVINATGVVIHTNLGRAPMSDAARRAISDEAAGYSALEYDLSTGKRGRRGNRAEDLIKELTGAEDALIVNNCAAAAFFVLTVFAAGGEVVISRGELVEIGGDFRVPDVLLQSGGILREVGTTNRTKLADYERAINRKTRVILRVHPSNYRIVGFTAMPSLDEMAALSKKSKVLFYEDIGSGAIIDLADAGLADEPVVSRSIAAGVDVVTFSGDKLLGGPQAGIIAGRKSIIEKLRKHPLYRALRVSKMVYAGLEATLEAFRRGSAFAEVPVLQMLALSPDEIARRVERFTVRLRKELSEICDLKFEILDGTSAIGGGAAPAVELKTKLIAISHKRISTSQLEERLRNSSPSVIVRIADDKVLIDLRTVSSDETAELIAAVVALA
ncbi:MAG: L-seryl-tRNA(Sec) selenium transferase [Pyrinomonadaceae bacterium]